MTLHRKRELLAAALVAAVALVATALLQTPAGGRVLHAAGLDGRPERYTALSFAEPSALPTELAGGATLRHTAFRVRNAEGERRRYAWRLVAAPDGAAEATLDEGAVEVPAGGRASVTPRARLHCGGAERVRVSVRLDGRPETVGFWVACPGAEGAGARG